LLSTTVNDASTPRHSRPYACPSLVLGRVA